MRRQLGPDLGLSLRRRMVLGYLGLLLVLYALAIATEVGVASTLHTAVGECISAVLCVLGLAVSVRAPLRGWRYVVAALVMCTAPLTALLFHTAAVGQIWSLIPLLFAMVFLRTWHSAGTTRIAGGLLSVAAVSCLLIAPAEVPPLWLPLFVVCIVGAGEVFGSVNSALLDVALRDPLTGVWNRAGVDRQARLVVNGARVRGQGAAVILFDVDDFKHVNDRYGHAAGDAVLIDLARRWSAALPDSAVLGRVGGDEFVVFAVGYDEARVRDLAARLAGPDPVRVTYGVAVGPAGPSAVSDLLAAADRDLYRHKRLRKRGQAPAVTRTGMLPCLGIPVIGS